MGKCRQLPHHNEGSACWAEHHFVILVNIQQLRRDHSHNLGRFPKHLDKYIDHEISGMLNNASFPMLFPENEKMQTKANNAILKGDLLLHKQ